MCELAQSVRVRVVQARAWADWIRAVRGEIAERKEVGDIDPDLTAPQHAYETLRELLAAIDALPDDAEHADLALPGRERLSPFVDQLVRARTLFDRWMQLGLLDSRPSEEADRFEQELRRCARKADDSG